MIGGAVQDKLCEQEDKRASKFPFPPFYSRKFVNCFGSISLLQSSMETIPFPLFLWWNGKAAPRVRWTNRPLSKI